MTAAVIIAEIGVDMTLHRRSPGPLDAGDVQSGHQRRIEDNLVAESMLIGGIDVVGDKVVESSG